MTDGNSVPLAGDSNSVPLAVALARIAAEQARLATLVAEIEALLAEDPALARHLDGPARQGLQRLDYLRQALDCLARAMQALPARDPVALEALTRDLPLADLARRLAGAPDPAPHPARAQPSSRARTSQGLASQEPASQGEVDLFG